MFPVAAPKTKTHGWFEAKLGSIPKSGIRSVSFSFADQALAVGGNFVANVVLARAVTKEEYGMFALSYSVFTFLAAIHNSTVLEPFTVYGSGRYQSRFSPYLRLMLGVNAFVGMALSVLVLFASLAIHWMAPRLFSWSFVGLGMSVGILLSGGFLRRIFYVQRQPFSAAQASLVCFTSVVCGLWMATRVHQLNGFSVFIILAFAWTAAGIALGWRLKVNNAGQSFLKSEPDYWREHWKYSRWVLATALVFQLTTQGYYWLLAVFLSVKDVAELRAIYLLISPVEQVFTALTLLVLPALAAAYANRNMLDFSALLKRYGLGLLTTAALFAIVVRMTGKFMLHTVYAGKFDGLAPLLYLLGFLPLLMGVSSVMASALNAAEKPKLVFGAYVCSGAVTFLAGIPLVAHFGLQGAVYGMLFSGAVFTAALVFGFVSKINNQFQSAAIDQLLHNASVEGGVHRAQETQ
jgi:O-antigen/teichoic acid export membrane protein